MKIKQQAIAGTLESSDLMVKVLPNESLEVIIKSDVYKQFGTQIKQVVDSVLAQLEVTTGLIIIEDKGALDCAIKARVQCAILRGAKYDMAETSLLWSQLL